MLICPNLKNPDVAREFEELEKATSKKAAYAIWSLNNGNPIDRAPNGEPSILFQNLLNKNDGDRIKAIREKARYFDSSYLNTNNWLNPESNGAEKTVDEDGTVRLSLPSHTQEKPRQIVLDPQGDNKFYVHIKIWDGEKKPGKISNGEKQILFDALFRELPYGAEILVPKSSEKYLATRGTIAAMKRLSKDDRFEKGSKGDVMYKDDKDDSIKTYSGTSFIKKPSIFDVDENGEPIMPIDSDQKQTETLAISDTMMAHLEYQDSSTRKRNIKENKKKIEDYYLNDQALLDSVGRRAALEYEVLKRSIDFWNKNYGASKTQTRQVRGENARIAIQNWKKRFGIQWLKPYVYVISKVDIVKVVLNKPNVNDILKEQIQTALSNMTPDQIYEEMVRVELEKNDSAFHIKSSILPGLREQILRKNQIHKNDPVWVEYQIEKLKELPNTPDDNAFVDCVIRWLKNNSFDFKHANGIREVFDVARKKGLDTQRFKTAMDMIKAVVSLNETIKSKPITNISKYRHIHFNRTETLDGHTVEIYDVDDSLEGKTDVCQILADTSPIIDGKPLEYSPWCLSTYTVHNGIATPSPSANNWWGHYNAGRRQIAICGGYPIAFNSSSSPEDFWWDFNDNPQRGRFDQIEISARENKYQTKINDDARSEYYDCGPFIIHKHNLDAFEFFFDSRHFQKGVYAVGELFSVYNRGDGTKVINMFGRYDLRININVLKNMALNDENIKNLIENLYNDVRNVTFDINQCLDIINRIKNIDQILFDFYKEHKNDAGIRRNYMKERQEYFLEHYLEILDEPDDRPLPIALITEEDALWRSYHDNLEKPVKQELSNLLKDILRRYHFVIVEDDLRALFGQDVLGMFDYLEKVVYLSNTGNANAISEAEEFCHAFIKMMGSAYHKEENRHKYPGVTLYSELRDLIEQTAFYKHIYEEYKNVYRYPNGQPDDAKIKEEALGKALATVLNDKWQEKEDATFFTKMKKWINMVLSFFKKLLTKNNTQPEAIDQLLSELNKIADSIIDGSYVKKYLQKVDPNTLVRHSVHDTIENAIAQDGGVALDIINTLQAHGGILSGSISFRDQTPVFRSNLDALHDLDFAFPLSMHNIHMSYATNPRQFPSMYYLGPNNYFTEEIVRAAITSNPATAEIFRVMEERYPGFRIMYSYMGETNVVVNCIICQNQELVDRFMSMDGGFNQRLEHFTEEERAQMRFIDMFFNGDNEIASDIITNFEYGINMANWRHSFREKMKYGRAKDVLDYQNLDPFDRHIVTRQNPALANTYEGRMAHVGSSSSTDKIRQSAEKIRARFGVLNRTYEKMHEKSRGRQKLANEIFELYGELKRIDDFEAVTKALDFAKRRLGIGRNPAPNNILSYLRAQEAIDFAGMDADKLVDMMQNSIGFFENLIEKTFPEDVYMTDEARNDRALVTDTIRNTIKPLWAKAMYVVGDRIIDDNIERFVTASDEDKTAMKEVAKDWMHKNIMYGDIKGHVAYLQNAQYAKNPIIKQAHRLIETAETKKLKELQPLAAKITKDYRRANKKSKKMTENWQTIFMEFDSDGIPTGNFVRDINYGQYKKDLDAFIVDLNDSFKKKHGFFYYEDEDGNYINSLTKAIADDEEWVNGVMPPIIEYRLAIEEFKCKYADRRYTFEYYKERMSVPYKGPDPLLTNTTGNYAHGLSPKTLSKYSRIQSNINFYLNKCYRKSDGLNHPEDLSVEDWSRLEQWRSEMDALSNPYNPDGTIKTSDDYKAAIEIRAWEKWIGENMVSEADIESFYAEAMAIYNECSKTGNYDKYNKFLRYNSTIGINPNFISQTIANYSLNQYDANALHGRLLRTGLQRLVGSRYEYTRDLAKQVNSPSFWMECKLLDQLIEDNRLSSGRDFAEMMEKNFTNDLIIYHDVNGNAYDALGNIVPKDKEKSTPGLKTWFDYMIAKYTNDILASPTRTIPGLIDRATGNQIVFNGTSDEVKDMVYQLFTYVHTYEDEDGETVAERLPLTIFSMLMPKEDTFVNNKTGRVERTITNVPTGRFSVKTDKSGKYLNDVFDPTKQLSEQPKRIYYDNSEQFNSMSREQRDLYDTLISVCEEMQKLYRPNGAIFNYRLPQINAQTMALLSRIKADGFVNVSKAIFDAITTVEENDENMRTSDQYITNPDGSVANDVPLKFVSPLKDPSRITTDITGAVILFADMALNYKYKCEIDDEIKTMRYNMAKEYRDLKPLEEGEREANEGTVSLEMMDTMLNKHMYGNQWAWQTRKEEPPTRGEVAWKKALRTVQRLETTQMLGLNILSMVVGFLDANVRMIRECINGKYMRPGDLVTGLARCLRYTPQVIKNIGNPLANNKFTGLMQLFGISKGVRATFEHMNWGRIRKIGANILMGGFSMLDYMATGLLLMSHMNNVRLYNEDGEDTEIKPGFYTLYQLEQEFVRVGRKKSQAVLAHTFCRTTAFDAYEFRDGACFLKDEYNGNKTVDADGNPIHHVAILTDDIATEIRTKTISRGALYNGMNPDNDIPKAKQTGLGQFLLSMRGWMTQSYQHMMSGGTDNVVRTFTEEENFETKFGVTRKKTTVKKDDLSNYDRSRRMSWNYETGTPQDQIYVGLARSFTTLWKYMTKTLFRNLPDGDPNKVKFSYVEKYAWRDALVWLASMAVLMALWPLANDSAREVPPPKNEDQAGVNDDPWTYMRDKFFPNQYYKLQLSDVMFRTIESSITSMDPFSAMDVLTSMTVLQSGFNEHFGMLNAASDVLGLSGHSLDDVVDRGGYKYYTRGQRFMYKFFGPMDNMHTAFTYYGLTSNQDFYTKKYGKIYNFFGYDFSEPKQKKGKGNKSKFGDSHNFGGSKNFGGGKNFGGSKNFGNS